MFKDYVSKELKGFDWNVSKFTVESLKCDIVENSKDKMLELLKL